MGSNGSKATSSCSSSATSSASESFRKGRSKGFRGFHSYCLGTSSASHDSDNEDQVLDEVHQQSVILSSSPSVSSIGSVPAHINVVESLPVKLYKKLHKHQEDVSQALWTFRLEVWNCGVEVQLFVRRMQQQDQTFDHLVIEASIP